MGTAVAQTIGTQIIDIHQVGIGTLNIALIGTLFTLFLCWKMGVPTSTSFALIGGMSGAGLTLFGPTVVVWAGLLKVVLSLILAEAFGGFADSWCTPCSLVLLRRVSIRFGVRMAYTQYLSSALVSFGYGFNDEKNPLDCWQQYG